MKTARQMMGLQILLEKTRLKPNLIKLLMMSFFFNGMFSATYHYYSGYKNESPRISAIMVVFVSQFSLFALFLILIGKLVDQNFFLILPNKWAWLPIFIVWIFILHRLFSVSKVNRIVEEFELYAESKKKLFKMAALSCFIMPAVLCLLLMKR